VLALSVLGSLDHLFDLNCFVVEWLSDYASWTLHGDDTGLDSDSHICNHQISDNESFVSFSTYLLVP